LSGSDEDALRLFFSAKLKVEQLKVDATANANVKTCGIVFMGSLRK
jgi:hypothetical protein